jgi:pimeloyl-ACP methyl ester carboxylesterase
MNKLISFLVVIMFLISSCKKEDFSSVSDEFRVRHANADIPVYVYGNNSEKIFIIFIHGGPGDSGYANRAGKAASELEKRYVMVYYDQRGQGMSEGKYNSEDISIDIMAEDLHALVQVLKHKYGDDSKIFLLGHSWGGTLGTAYLLKNNYQNEINGWIEADGSHDFPKINIDAIKMFIKIGNEQIALNNHKEKWMEIVSWAQQIDTSYINRDMIIEINSQAHYVENYLLEDNVIQKPAKKTMRDLSVFYSQNTITRIFSGYYTFMGNDKFFNDVVNNSFTPELHNITIPCLFLWGKYDFTVPPTLGDDAYNRVNTTDKNIVIFDKSGHSPMLNQAGDFVDEVIDFIEMYK